MLLAGISLREREHRGSLYLRSNRVCSCLYVEVAHFLERPATGTLGTHDSDTLRRSRSVGLFPVDQPSVDCTTHITVYCTDMTNPAVSSHHKFCHCRNVTYVISHHKNCHSADGMSSVITKIAAGPSGVIGHHQTCHRPSSITSHC